MTRLYIPYAGKSPTSLSVNGHKLILVSRSKAAIEDELDAVGADRLKAVKIEDSEMAEDEFLTALAKKNHAGILLVPEELSYTQLKRALEDNLPWIQ